MTADSSGLGTKPVARLALTMSVPTIVAQAANASYTIIDRLFIGHIPEVGDAAMTGVGICFPILLAVTAFASLIGAGGAPRASIELGRGNFKKAERILGTSAAFLVAIALTLTVILQATKEPVLRAFGASDANIGYAVDFITIYLVGTVFVQLTLGLNNFISAQGKTTIAMTSVLIGTGTSIILDPVFIFVLGWGVKGAAVANVIAQLISSVWIILFLASGRSAIRLRPSNIRFNRVIVPILTLGLAPFIMQITECLINVVFNVGALIIILWAHNSYFVNNGVSYDSANNLWFIASYPIIPCVAIATVVARRMYLRTGNAWTAGLFNAVVFTFLACANTSFSNLAWVYPIG